MATASLLPKALRSQKCRFGTPAFDQGVRNQRRAVDDRNQFAGLDPFLREQLDQPILDSLRRVFRCGEHLANGAFACIVVDEYEVRERPSDVDA